MQGCQFVTVILLIWQHQTKQNIHWNKGLDITVASQQFLAPLFEPFDWKSIGLESLKNLLKSSSNFRMIGQIELNLLWKKTIMFTDIKQEWHWAIP
jgi:hypothetical protein